MNRLTIIGDSNIYRNVSAQRLAERVGKSVTIHKAARRQTFDLGLERLEKDDDVVMVSALSNLLCDTFGTKQPTEEQLSDEVKRHIEQLATSTYPKLILIVPPFYRRTPTWFTEIIQTTLRQLSIAIKKDSRFTILPEFKVKDSDLLDDGVHLDSTSGQLFYEYIVSCTLDVFPLASKSTATTPPTPSADATSAEVLNLLKTSVLPKLDELTNTQSKVTDLERAFLSRKKEDDAMFARLSEEADFAWNQSKGTRIVVVGLKGLNYPKTLQERKEYLSKAMLPFLETVVGERVYDFYPRVAYMQGNKIPPFVIRFPNESDCIKFKREAHKKAKDFNHLDGVNFFPCVTPATRVRIEVLRAISRKLTTDERSAYCPIYGARPLLHVGPRVNGRVETKETLTYVTAVLRYQHLVNIRDLFFAYKALGSNFGGSLRQTFILLNEEDRKHSEKARDKASETNRGQKRPPDSTENSRSKR